MGIGDCKICHVFKAIIELDCFEILGLNGINLALKNKQFAWVKRNSKIIEIEATWISRGSIARTHEHRGAIIIFS